MYYFIFFGILWWFIVTAKSVTLNRERQPAYQSMHKSQGKKYNNHTRESNDG